MKQWSSTVARLGVLVGAGLAALGLASAVLLTMAAAPRAQAAQAGHDPAAVIVTPSLDCRLGYAAVYGAIDQYPITLLLQLNADHYLNFGASAVPQRPLGMEYIPIVRLHQLKQCPQWDCPYVEPYTYTVSPGRATIAQIAAANPGMLWFLGNEIDRRDYPGLNGQTFGQDEMLPELYARAFHELRAVIKSADPTARIANAGVIQATPLRLQYLDRVWDEYLRLYGTPIPVDEWNVHGFIYREKRYYPGCPDCWGADVPPGIDVPWGRLYEADDTISMTLFAEQITAFRYWMWSKGQVDKPLIVSEYGIFPLDYYPPGAGAQYVFTGTFAYMRDAVDPVTGYPGDDRRLVQRWVFYSLDDDTEYGGAHMIDPGTNALTDFGRLWAAYVGDPANGFQERLPNLSPGPLRTDPAVLFAPGGQPLDVTFYPAVNNSGPVSATQAFSVRLIDSQWPLTGRSQFGVLPGCGRRTAGSGVTLNDMLPGLHILTVQVDPDALIAESDETDNVTQVSVLIATEQIYMPLVTWNGRAVIP